MPGCQGLYVTSYFKSKIDQSSMTKFWSTIEDEYVHYKGKTLVNFPEELKGYEWKDSHKVIGIYIDTPAFDVVTKDVSVTWSDILSGVGGAFGLFTGFSIISGVEILFYLVNSLTKWQSKKK